VTEVIFSGATTVPVDTPNGPNYVQASSASRNNISILRFVVEVLRGFKGRFK
jgi:hypothetical protein